MPGLLTYTTDLKSLKFGVPPVSDRPGGGNSGQPYIVDPIPGQDEPIPGSDLAAPDFLLRGGINSAADATDDVLRLGKYFFNFKNVNGALFVAKQNELSAVAVQTQATGNGSGLGLNEGTYTPLSTLAQAGIGFLGGHVDKQGINLFRGITTYSDVSNIVIGAPNGDGNRLVNLYNTQVPHQGNEFSLENPVTLYSYYGGPNSNLGLGNTNIKFATDNKGAPTLTGIATSDYQAGLRENPTNLFKSPLGVSSKYVELNGGGKLITEGQIGYDTVDGVTLADISKENGITWTNIDGTPPKPKLQNPTELFISPVGDDATSMYMFTTGELINSNLTSDDGISWRENLTNPYATGVKGTLAKKEYVPRNFNLANPTELFIYPEPEDLKTAAGAYMFASGEYVIDDGITDDDGISWRSNLTDPYATGTKGTLATKTYKKRSNRTPNPVDKFIYPTGSIDYSTLLNTTINSGSLESSNGVTWELQGIETSVYKSGSLTSNNRIEDQNTKVLTQEQINDLSKSTQTNKQNPGTEIVNFQQTINSIAPNYKSKEIIIDNDSGDNRNSYTSPGLKSSEGKIIDKVNAQPIYRSTDAEINNNAGRFVEDLVPFRIGAINPQSETVSDYGFEKDYIHFRAYIDSFSDTYNGNWNSTKYMGRGEKLYSYDGFDRTINLSFTVAAQSKGELLEQYKKLNFLVSNLAPEYTNAGYMNGPLVTLTMGGWCFELPGFIESITLDVPEESPWETSVENDIAILPHIVKVSGFTFKPIHDFKVQKQQNTFDTDTQFGKLTNYGVEDYVNIRSRFGTSMEDKLVNSKPQ